MIDKESEEGTNDAGDQAQAAQHDEGQEQEPKQAQEDSSSLWDSQEHSEAPGPFGTGGDKWHSADEEEE